jgi:hypothetical protein
LKTGCRFWRENLKRGCCPKRKDGYGIKIHRTVVGNSLKKIKQLKSGSSPAKADGQKRRWFYHTILKPLMDRAKKREISLLHLEAPHFVMGCDFLGYI